MFFFDVVYGRSDRPAFMDTLFQDLPWDEGDEACFTKILLHEPDKKPSFHKPDVFHTVSLGIAKTFVASSLAILQELANGTSIESRISDISSMYLEYCKDPHLFFSGFVSYVLVFDRFDSLLFLLVGLSVLDLVTVLCSEPFASGASQNAVCSES